MHPTIGRIVHLILDVYHDEAGNSVVIERPAIITEVHTRSDEEGAPVVSLVIFGKDLTGASVPKFAEYSENREYGTWHWPERG